MKKKTLTSKERQLRRIPLFATLFFALIYLAIFFCNKVFVLPESVVAFIDYGEVSRLFDLPVLYLSLIGLVIAFQKSDLEEAGISIVLSFLAAAVFGFVVGGISYLMSLNGWAIFAVAMAVFWGLIFHQIKLVSISALILFIIILFLKGFINALIIGAISFLAILIFLPIFCLVSQKKFSYILFWLGIKDKEE